MSPLRADTADDSLADTAYFSVHARAEAGVMPRVLEIFAKRGLVPTRWHSRVAGRAGTRLSIDIAIDGLGHETSLYIAACLRQIADVEMVQTAGRAAPGRAA